MALYVLLVYPDEADYGYPAEVQEVIGPFGTEAEAMNYAKRQSEMIKFDVSPLEFPT